MLMAAHNALMAINAFPENAGAEGSSTRSYVFFFRRSSDVGPDILRVRRMLQ